MIPKYSIRAYEGGEVVESAATGRAGAAIKIANKFLTMYQQVDLYEYKGMREGIAMYERIPV